MHRRSLRSPNRRHEARLFRHEDVRFGPTSYRLELDDWRFEGRVFGRSFLWSPDSRRFFVQEWYSTASSFGPETVLVAIDPATGSSEVIAECDGGFIEPVDYRDGCVVFRRSTDSTRTAVEQRYPAEPQIRDQSRDG